ncbi:MAG: 1,4-alpha-glucan branching enzyme, partial [Limisphaerales bacterium]
WVDCSDHKQSVLSFLRRTDDGGRPILVVLNLTPVARSLYRLGLPGGGAWVEILNSDAEIYGGSNVGNAGGITAEEEECHGHPWSAEFSLPPLSVIAFRSEAEV